MPAHRSEVSPFRGEAALALMVAVAAVAVGAVGLFGDPSVATTLHVAGATFGLSAAVFAAHSAFSANRQRRLVDHADEAARRRAEAQDRHQRLLKVEATRLAAAMDALDRAMEIGELHEPAHAAIAARLYDEATNTARELAMSGDPLAAEKLVVSTRALWPLASQYGAREEPQADSD